MDVTLNFELHLLLGWQPRIIRHRMSRRQSDDRNTGEEFVFSGTNEQFGRPLCVPWVIVLSNVPRSETFERNAIVLVESSVFFCFVVFLCLLLLLLFSVGFVSPFEMGPRVRAQTRMYAPFFFYQSFSGLKWILCSSLPPLCRDAPFKIVFSWLRRNPCTKFIVPLKTKTRSRIYGNLRGFKVLDCNVGLWLIIILEAS